MEKIKVLSLFDGISCGRVALERVGFDIEYYASEIDKYAIQIAQKNYPDTIQMGDITKLKGEDFQDIDLLIGGSPCQGFSFAGKQLNFDDPRSALFFEFMRILKEVKPKYFLLENVRMKQEFQDIISEHLGVKPIMINSSLVSAQNRVRLYWTNIPNVKQPKDKGIFLQDILEDAENKYYFGDRIGKTIVGENVLNKIRVSQRTKYEKSRCLTAGGQSITNAGATNIVDEKYNLSESNIKTINRNLGSKGKTIELDNSLIEKMTYPSRIKQKKGNIKCPTLTAAMGTGGGNVPVIVRGCVSRTFPRYKIDNKKREKRIEIRKDEKSNCLTSVQNDSLVLNKTRLRKLTEIECERLQTLPDNYTEGISMTQRYKALGNGWTVDVISHIFKNIKIKLLTN